MIDPEDLPDRPKISKSSPAPRDLTMRASFLQEDTSSWGSPASRRVASPGVAARRSSVVAKASDDEDDEEVVQMVRMGMAADDEDDDSFDIPWPKSAISDSRARPTGGQGSRGLYLSRNNVKSSDSKTSNQKPEAAPPQLAGDLREDKMKLMEKRISNLTSENERLHQSLKELKELRQPKVNNAFERKGTAQRSPPDHARRSPPPLGANDVDRIRHRQVIAEVKHSLSEQHKQEVASLEAQLRSVRQEAISRQTAHSIVVERLKKTIAELEGKVLELDALLQQGSTRARYEAEMRSIDSQCTTPAESGTSTPTSNPTRGRAGATHRGHSMSPRKVSVVQVQEAIKEHSERVKDRVAPQGQRAGEARKHNPASAVAEHGRGKGAVVQKGEVKVARNSGSSLQRGVRGDSQGRHVRLDNESAARALSPRLASPQPHFDQSPVVAGLDVISEGARFLLGVRGPSRVDVTLLEEQGTSVSLLPDERSHQDVGKKMLPGGAVEEERPGGARLITFPNGTQKELTADGRVMVRFANGDVKEECEDGTVTYFYRVSKTTEISYPNGLILTHFADDQMEKAHPDGTKEIIFPDGTRRRFNPSGVEIF